MAGIQCYPAAAVFLYLIIFSELSFAASKSPGFSLRLIPRDSVESPLYPGNLTQFERIERLIHFSNAKAELMKLRSTRNATFADEKYLTALQRQGYYYIGEVKIGTPPQIVYLMVDTSAGLIWTQCQPCRNCFPQDNSIYDLRASSTYQRLSCEHPSCNYHDEHSIFQCVNGECIYSLYYGNGAIGPTKGVASLESFKFLTDAYDNTIEFSIVFGCSNDDTNFGLLFGYHGNKISGILGLNLSPESLYTQLFDLIGGMFSYCVVPFGNHKFSFDMHPHVLRFGDDVVVPRGNIPTTHYYVFEGADYYYLDCLDISIGDHRLGFPRGTFDAALSSGFIIDSGAPLTMLTTRAINGINVFGRVITALMDHYDYYHLVRVPPTQNPTRFQLCYKNRKDFRKFPSMTFHFEGANYTVDARYMNINYENEGFFCVAMIGSSGESVLGAFHMQDMRIIHNGNIDAIQFYHVNCAHDHL